MIKNIEYDKIMIKKIEYDKIEKNIEELFQKYDQILENVLEMNNDIEFNNDEFLKEKNIIIKENKFINNIKYSFLLKINVGGKVFEFCLNNILFDIPRNSTFYKIFSKFYQKGKFINFLFIKIKLDLLIDLFKNLK
jgi:hypothetical protein